MNVCPRHGARPWSSKFGCMDCLAETIPNLPPPPPVPMPKASALEEGQKGFAFGIWVWGLILVGGGLTLGIILLFIAGRAFDFTVLSGIDALRPHDPSGGVVTGWMWKIYFFIFFVCLIGIPTIWLAWMIFWSKPKTRKAVWSLGRLAVGLRIPPPKDRA